MNKEVFCKLAHVLFGIFTVISSKISPILPLVFLITFVLYEADEEIRIGDNMIEEMKEYGYGLVIGLALAFALMKWKYIG